MDSVKPNTSAIQESLIMVYPEAKTDIPTIWPCGSPEAEHHLDLNAIKKLFNGGSFWCQSGDGKMTTLLHASAGFGMLEAVKYLVKDKQIGPDIEDESNCMPLHNAVAHKHYLTVEFLIKNGSSVHSKGMNGCSPLHFAALNGDLMMYKLLKEHGGDDKAENDEGETPSGILSNFYNSVIRSENHPPVEDACQTENKASLQSTKNELLKTDCPTSIKVQDGDKSSTHENTSSQAGNKSFRIRDTSSPKLNEDRQTMVKQALKRILPKVAREEQSKSKRKRKGKRVPFAGNKIKQGLHTDVQTIITTNEAGNTLENDELIVEGDKPVANRNKYKRTYTRKICSNRKGGTNKSDFSKKGKRRNYVFRQKSDKALKEYCQVLDMHSSTDDAISVRCGREERSYPLSHKFNVADKEKDGTTLKCLLSQTERESTKMISDNNIREHENKHVITDTKEQSALSESTTPALAKSSYDQQSTTTDMSRFVDVESHDTNSASPMMSLIPNFQSLGVETGERSQENEIKDRYDHHSTITDMSRYVDVQSHDTNSASPMTSAIPNFQSLGVETGEKVQEDEIKKSKIVNPVTQATIKEYFKKKPPKRIVKNK